MNSIEQLQSELAIAHSRISELETSSAQSHIFLNIFNSSPLPFALNDVYGNIINVNPMFTRLYGYKLSDIPTLNDWWPKAYPNPKYREWVISSWEKNTERAKKTNTDFEPIKLDVHCKNGAQRTVLASCAPLTDFEQMYLVIFYDITDLTQANSKINILSDSLTQMTLSLEQQHKELILEKEKALANEERLSLAMQGANDGLWDWDIANDKMYYSPRWKSMLGYAEDELVDHFSTWEGLLHPDDLEQTLAQIQSFIDAKIKKYEVEFRMRHKDGHYINILSRSFMVESEEGEITRLVGTHIDITARKKSEEKLSYQSTHDSLTGLLNRREFKRRTELLLAVPAHNRPVHALCYMDLDQFKVVNDTCGHSAGDELLRQLSFILEKAVRQSDIVARLGGDEFAILMEDCSFSDAHRITLSIQSAIEDFQFIWEGRSFRIGASIGLMQITEKALDFIEVLKVADVACYIAKDKGRNRIHVHYENDKELVQRQSEMLWVNRIQYAIDEDSFRLYAQAIEPLTSDSNKHYELLLRMIDEHDNVISPGAFLPAAERYHLIVKVDRWVVKNAFSLIVRNAAFLRNINFVSINLSGQSLTDESFLDFIIEQLQTLGVNSHKICFEITETAAISNLELAGKFINKLKKFGCRFALDDFGSGLSSFGYLKNLKVDYLKIDGIFVKDIASDPIDHAMVKAINEIGQTMGMKTIAEFVETEQIKSILKQMGVDYVQGYAIHKPQSLSELFEK